MIRIIIATCVAAPFLAPVVSISNLTAATKGVNASDGVLGLDSARLFYNNDEITTTFHRGYCSILMTNESFGHSLWSNISESDNILTFEFGQGHEKAANVLEFSFPFYYYQFYNAVVVSADGHVGLCYNTSDHCVKDDNYLEDAISPLKADFFWNTSLAHNIKAQQKDDGLTVQWENMVLSSDVGNFSFQMSMFNDGTIVFLYKNLPAGLPDVNRAEIGIKTAHYKSLPLRKRIIESSDQLELAAGSISNWTTIIFTNTPLRSNHCSERKNCKVCSKRKTCGGCTKNNISLDFPQCFWCAETNTCLNRCEGMLQKEVIGCDVIFERKQCSKLKPPAVGSPSTNKPLAADPGKISATTTTKPGTSEASTFEVMTSTTSSGETTSSETSAFETRISHAVLEAVNDEVKKETTSEVKTSPAAEQTTSINHASVEQNLMNTTAKSVPFEAKTAQKCGLASIGWALFLFTLVALVWRKWSLHFKTGLQSFIQFIRNLRRIELDEIQLTQTYHEDWNEVN